MLNQNLLRCGSYGKGSTIQNYGFLAAVTLFEKVLQQVLACRHS